MEERGILSSKSCFLLRSNITVHEEHHICVPEEKRVLGIIIVPSRKKEGGEGKGDGEIFLLGALSVFAFDWCFIKNLRRH